MKQEASLEGMPEDMWEWWPCFVSGVVMVAIASKTRGLYAHRGDLLCTV